MCPNNNTNPESAPHAPSPPLGQWTTGLCGCFEDPSSCWVTFCCPFITFGRIAEIVDQGRTSQPETIWCLPIFMVHVYTHARTEPNLEDFIRCQQSRAGIAVSITSAFVALFVKSTIFVKTLTGKTITLELEEGRTDCNIQRRAHSTWSSVSAVECKFSSRPSPIRPSPSFSLNRTPLSLSFFLSQSHRRINEPRLCRAKTRTNVLTGDSVINVVLWSGLEVSVDCRSGSGIVVLRRHCCLSSFDIGSEEKREEREGKGMKLLSEKMSLLVRDSFLVRLLSFTKLNGWTANAYKMKGGTTTPPIPAPRMTR
ncbi:protein PLANT CADMIUM RESISTANCE 7-like [Fagus crenata]